MPDRPSNPVRRLSPTLRPIYDLELSLGNVLVSVAEPMGPCPLAVFMRDPLHFDEIARTLALPPTIKKWVNDDPHYSPDAGFQCETTRQCISGPSLK